jgi:hypothetical protein
LSLGPKRIHDNHITAAELFLLERLRLTRAEFCCLSFSYRSSGPRLFCKLTGYQTELSGGSSGQATFLHGLYRSSTAVGGNIWCLEDTRHACEKEKDSEDTEATAVLLVVLEELILPHGVSASVCFASLRAAVPSMSREIPVIIKFTPTSVPMAHTELDGQ